MIIHFLKEDNLAALKINLSVNLKYYNNKTNEWVYDFFDRENPFAEYKQQIEDFHFSSAMNDVENSIILYSAMKDLSDTQAIDERLWAGLCHGDFWPYMHERWCDKKISGDPVSSILWRYFFNVKSGNRRALFRNTLSRLWWIGRLTYDESRKDPFELTKYLADDFATKSLILFSNNYTGNPNVIRGLVSALMELDQEGYSSTMGASKRNEYYLASQFLNMYGGSHILDYYSEDEIREKVLQYMRGLSAGNLVT